MTESTYQGRIVKLEVGVSGGSHTDIRNCKSIKWRKVHTITPQLLPSSKTPAGWLQSHSWVEGEFALQTKNTVLDSYASHYADAAPILYFVVTGETTDKTPKTFSFTGFIIANVEQEFGASGEALFVYKFLAYYVTEG